MSEPERIAVDLCLGVTIGFLSGLFGIGGGFVAIPLLGLIYGYDEQHAQGTAMVMVIPNVLTALWHYTRRTKLELRVALPLVLAALPFSFWGAHIAVAVASSPLRRGFAIFILGIAVLYAVQSLQGKGLEVKRAMHLERWPLAIPLGAVAGMISGLFGVGGAILSVPLMVIAFGFAQAVAQGISLVLVTPGLLVALGTYGGAGDVVWTTGLLLAAGGFVTIGYGVALAHRLPERRLRLFFAMLCAVSSAGLWVRA